jgi:hypothetical protein
MADTTRVKMLDTTRVEGQGLVAGDVVDVPSALADRLVADQLAEKSDAKETSAEVRARENPPPAPVEPAPAGYPAALAAEQEGRAHMIGREDVADLQPGQTPPQEGPKPLNDPRQGGPQGDDDDGGRGRRRG